MESDRLESFGFLAEEAAGAEAEAEELCFVRVASCRKDEDSEERSLDGGFSDCCW